MLPDILNYVPDPNNGRPLVGAKVYFLIGGYDAPDRDSDLDITKIAPITANGDVVPQPLYTSKGGTIRVGSQVDQPPLVPSGLTQKVAVYDKCGKLVYQVEYSAQGPFVSSTALAATDSSVLIGGITAQSLVALAQGGGGGGSGNGIEYVQTMPVPGTAGTTLFQQNNYDLGFTINDGDSIPIVEFSMLGLSAYTAGGGGGVTYTFQNSTGSGNTLLKNPSTNTYEWKRIIAGANVSITDDGNALTINSSGGGGGGTTTTLSNAGATGLGLVMPISGADYPIKRLQAGTNVTITDNGTYYTIDATGGGGGGITSLQNVNDAVGAGIYKETTAGVGFFRRVQSSDASLVVSSDADDVDFTVNSVAYTKVGAVPTARLLGRSTAGTGAAEAITIGTNLTLSAGVLSASGGGVTDGDKGDIVVSGSGATWTLDSAVVSAFSRTVLDDTTAAGWRSTISAQEADATLTALAGVTTAANKLIYATAADAFATTDLTALARTLLGGAAVNNMLTTLGIITITNANGTTLRFPTAGATSGIQICFKTGLSTGLANTSSGGVFVSAGQQWTFPNVFSAAPAVMGFVTSADPLWIGGGLSATSVDNAYYRGYSGVSGSAGVMCMIAIGTY